ncbi:MAG: SIMPL domain-containing protein [Acidilobus sp.]
MYDATATFVLRVFPQVTANGIQATGLKCPQTPFTIEGTSVNRCEEIDRGKGNTDKGEEVGVKRYSGVRRYSMTFSFNVEAESDDKALELALRDAKEKAELIAYGLSLGLGHAFEVEDVSLKPLQSKDDKEQRVKILLQPNLSYFYAISNLISEDKVKSAIESALKLEKAVSKAKEKDKTVNELMRVVRWWVSGLKDEDPVDRFLRFYFACEMLAAIKRYNRCKEFGNKYLDGYYKLDDININQVRNKLVHAVGEDKDKAEELAVRHADEFGSKVFSAIKRVISEEIGVSLQ